MPALGPLPEALARALPGAAGAVVNLLDQRVWSLTPHFVSYTVSKAALWALTRQMALALAPRIRVNAIGPGPALPSSRQTPESFARQCASVPLRHGTSPEEVGRALLAILSLPAMTGQMIALDGGQHLQWGTSRVGGRRNDRVSLADAPGASGTCSCATCCWQASIGWYAHEHGAPQRIRSTWTSRWMRDRRTAPTRWTAW